MTAAEVRAWLSARQPVPPPPLAARLERLLAACPAAALAESRSLAAALSSLALTTLASLDGRDPTGEDVAMDLLAADAFVTYAFEAAAETGEDAGQVAEAVLARLDA